MALHTVAYAQNTALTGSENVISLPELTVTADAERNQSDVSVAAETLPAQVDVITGEQVDSLPVTDYVDLFRRTPGAVPINFGQGDIGNAFSLRGFAGDHGQDVAVFVDGVPINVPNHAHAHGLADSGWVIPEIIDRIEVIKGPFSALYGNFALGGVVNITTKRAEPNPTAEFAAGSYGAARALGTYSHELIGPTPFLAYEINHRDGYRDNSDSDRYNAFNKLTLPFGPGALSLTARAVKREFGAPGYLPLEEVKDGLISRRAAVNDTDGGDSEYYGLVANYIPNGEAGLNATLYAGNEELNRFADFTLPGPPFSQRQDHSEREYAGWRVFYNFTWEDRAALTLGTDGEFDDGIYQRLPTDGFGNRIDVSRDRRVEQLSTGLFAQGQLRVLDDVKLVGGVRYDRFDLDIDNRIIPENSGDADSDIVSPKIGLVYSPLPILDIFVNTGTGFRSPSASEISPDELTADGLSTAEFGLDPAELRSSDIGLKFRPLPGLNIGLNYYQTETEREISVQPDGAVNLGNTERDGYEASIEYLVTENLDLFASYSAVDARLQNDARDYVVNVPYDTQTVGATWRKPLNNGMNLIVDGYVQRYGKQPLTADRVLEAPSVTRVAAKASLARGPVSGFLQLTYIPDRFASESIFDFGEIRYAPNPETEVLAGVKYEFE